jgi:adenosylmethionine-8-amino-7-oxononanoate aminotransferase
VTRFADACRRAGVLLIADEVATGFGRTGRLFACEWSATRPDLLCLGKGLTGGYLPMSATVAAGHVYDAFLGEDLGGRTFYHGHSFAGNALASAVALEHLRLLAGGDVLANVTARAAQLEALLTKSIASLPSVRAVRQRGLMVGIELAPPRPGLRWGRRVCAATVRAGVLLRPLGDVVVVMPPLTTTAEEADRIVSTLAAALAEIAVQDGVT